MVAALVASIAALPLGPAVLGSEPETASEQIAPGLVHHSQLRGEVAREPRFRVVVGSFESQSEADVALLRLVDAGREPSVSYRDGAYEVSLAELPTRAAAESARVRALAGGFEAAEIVEYGHDLLHAGGPWEIHVLEADPTRVRVEVAHALDAAFGLETTSDLSRRHEAIAAVNGGFYLVRGLLRGDSQGVLQIDGRLWSEPDRGRGAVGFSHRGGRVEARFGRLVLTSKLVASGGEELVITGINRARAPDDVVLYTPEFHRTTLTGPNGTELVVDDGAIAEVREQDGSSRIPAGGFVLSIGAEVAWPKEILGVGREVAVVTDLRSRLEPEAGWGGTESLVSAGPMLLHRGRRVDDPGSESISQVFYRARHPRTAVGARADGTLLFVTVDGRQPERSVGMALDELTNLLLEWGAVSAVNLDGGGSTTMVVGNRVVNSPSDAQGERANGDAVLIFARERESTLVEEEGEERP